MSNGSERIPERPVITNWIDNVPLRGENGAIVGRAKVSNKGEIKASIDIEAISKELYNMLTYGLYDGLSIAPHAKPAQSYSEEVRARHNKKES